MANCQATLDIYITSVFCESKLQYPLSFPHIFHVTGILLAFNEIYTVGNITINVLVYFPFIIIDFEGFYFPDIRACCAVFSTFFHASHPPGWMRFGIWGDLSPDQMVLEFPLPPKCSKRWLCKYLMEVGVLSKINNQLQRLVNNVSYIDLLMKMEI